MAQITAPIIAISLVLLSVFVPIAFIPGISGTLFRQFAITISAAMVISAVNALMLSPALCAVFLRHGGPRRGVMGRALGGIDWVRDRYAAIVRRLLRVTILSLAAVLVFAGGDHPLQKLSRPRYPRSIYQKFWTPSRRPAQGSCRNNRRRQQRDYAVANPARPGSVDRVRRKLASVVQEIDAGAEVASLLTFDET